MENIVVFCLFVGIGSTIALDIWVTLVKKITGIPPTDWGVVGRWLKAFPTGQFVVDNSNPNPPSTLEKIIGWLFHYVVGIAYAALIIIIFGSEFISAPTLLPTIVVGLILSTFAGLAILMPGLGGGFFGRLLPNKLVTYIYLIVAHGVFAFAQYGLAIIY